jgi:hypothetical protein
MILKRLGLFARVQAAVKGFVASPEAGEIRKRWESPGPR